MKKRILFLALIFVATLSQVGWAGCFPAFPTFGRWQEGCRAEWWNDSSLTFYAPFTDPASPLTLLKGTGSLSFTRATTATYVHPTTGLITTAASGQLRIEANGALIEGARTNLALQSSVFTSGWSNSHYTFTVGAISPAGDNTATTLGTDNGSYSRSLYRSFTSGNAVYTVSLFAKAGTVGWLGLSRGSSASSDGVFFDLSTGTVGTVKAGNTATIKSYGNGWYRCSMTTTLVSGTGYLQIEMHTADNQGATVNFSGTETIIMWGSQAEIGAFPSSYIPTVATAVTRNLSSLSVASSGNIDNAAGTLYTSWTPNIANTVAASGNYYIFDAGGLESYWNSTDDKIYLTDGTNTISTAALTFSASAAKDVAFSWGAAGLSITVDGTDTTGATYTTFSPGASTFFGADTTPANLLYGHHKNTRIWNRQFSVTERGTIAP